jgi:hypothetical protein
LKHVDYFVWSQYGNNDGSVEKCNIIPLSRPLSLQSMGILAVVNLFPGRKILLEVGVKTCKILKFGGQL